MLDAVSSPTSPVSHARRTASALDTRVLALGAWPINRPVQARRLQSRLGLCPGCGRTEGQQAFDRIAVESSPLFRRRLSSRPGRLFENECPICLTAVPEAAQAADKAPSAGVPFELHNYEKPLYLEGYNGSGSMWRGGKPRRLVRSLA